MRHSSLSRYASIANRTRSSIGYDPRRGGICHTTNRDGTPRNCFYRRLNFDTLELEDLDP